MDFLLGMDLGTSSSKAGLLNLSTGQLEHFNFRQYADYSEYDSDVLWERAFQTIAQTVSALGGKDKVIAIGVTGQMHGAVLYSSQGLIIGNLINWRDRKRCDPAMIELVNRLIIHDPSRSVGTRMACGFTGAILLWIKEKEADAFRHIDHFVLFTDFVRAKLLDRNDRSTDPTNAAGTGLFNTRLGEWHVDLIRQLDLPIRMFPHVYQSLAIAGALPEGIAKSLHLGSGVPIIYGGGDNQMSMLGSGLFSSGSPALINIGTAAQISKIIPSYQVHAGIDTRPFFDGQFALVGASLGGGGQYGDFVHELNTQGFGLSYPELDKLVLEVPAGADGLYYCTGPSRMNPDRKRGFFGNLDKRKSIAHQARAIIEGVLMDLYEFYTVIRQYDDSATIIGSGKALIHSIAWRQLASELFDKRLEIFNTENALLGASIMAGRGVDYFHRPSDWEHIIKYENGAVPNRANASFYAERFVDRWKGQAEDLNAK